eukprot:6304511-Pyramimonas_sp.AAC.2
MHKLDAVTWSLEGSFLERVSAFFIGGSPRLKLEEVVHTPGDRFRLQVRAPIVEGEREYTRSGHQSRKGRERAPQMKRTSEYGIPHRPATGLGYRCAPHMKRTSEYLNTL